MLFTNQLTSGFVFGLAINLTKQANYTSFAPGAELFSFETHYPASFSQGRLFCVIIDGTYRVFPSDLYWHFSGPDRRRRVNIGCTGIGLLISTALPPSHVVLTDHRWIYQFYICRVTGHQKPGKCTGGIFIRHHFGHLHICHPQIYPPRHT